ncbi:glycerol-1-phosphate dehydrogenase [NAD(P)+] [Mariniphaga anaerophila]|uniref:Glycerol-1-phosphate dehydrogenase [NAD(P)+] n=1 Tax=Mariniphaga anaerophila TaxID=1484053 RepID=A0A1M4V6J8_9BACT|nr:sn-glycerol-1-phosphate dehydrogenase [Mariniphaga anaerophila]SHE64611.1 glycerol-1-phosphate dehydrogenase [NAD(P)+] [Mariniphaga anaerophila]
MKLNVKEALESARDTRALIIDRNIIAQVSDLFRANFEGRKAVVVCDQTTFKVAGEKVYQCLKKDGLTEMEPFIYDEPKPYAEFGKVEKLEEFLKKNDAIPVAVGSGTLNDLTKLASSRAGRRYMCVATAASMDGYTAFGASITFEGAKQTFSCPAPQAVMADVEVIRQAPPVMTASGYADLFAKVTAGADWIIADALGVEPIDARAWSIVQDGLKEALADPIGAKAGELNAITPLVEGLILGGFAMQWSQSSRPASGAEHQFSHLWNMEHHTYNGETPSHGFQVGIATLAITRLYEKMLQTPFETLDVDACCNQWCEWPVWEQKITERFKDTDFLETALTQTKNKYINKKALKEQLTKLKTVWPELKKRLSEQLVPSEEVEKRLRAVGAPVEPEQIGISRERMKGSFIRASHIRSRFTILDIAVRTGYLEQWQEEIFE